MFDPEFYMGVYETGDAATNVKVRASLACPVHSFAWVHASTGHMTVSCVCFFCMSSYCIIILIEYLTVPRCCNVGSIKMWQNVGYVHLCWVIYQGIYKCLQLSFSFTVNTDLCIYLQVDFNSRNTVTAERQTFYCVPIPGENPWVKEISLSKILTLQSNAHFITWSQKNPTSVEEFLNTAL